MSEQPVPPQSDEDVEAASFADPDLGGEGLGDTVVRGVGMAGVGYVGAQVLTLGFYLVLARLISPHEFGVFTAGSLLATFGALFTESGMMAALIHRKDRIEEAASTAVLATIAGGIAFSLAALAASPLLGLLFHDDRVGEIGAAMAGVLLIRSVIVVPEALLQRRFSFLRRMVIQPVGVIALGTSAIIAASNGLGAWSMVIGYYAAALIDAILSWALVNWRPDFRKASIGMYRELVGYGRHVLASIMVLRLNEEIPVILLGRFVGSNPLGQYRYAERMSSTSLLVVIQSASYVLFPALSRITDDRERFRQACLRSLRLMCAVAFPLGLILVPLGVPLAVIVFGEVWKDAGYATMALAGTPVGGAIVAFATEVVKADGKPQVLVNLQAVMLVVGAAVAVALLWMGLIGVAIGTSAGALAAGGYALWKTADLLDSSMWEMLGSIVPSAVAGLVMAGVLVPIQFVLIDATSLGTLGGLALIAGESIVAAGIYLGGIRLLAPETANDLFSLVGRLLARLRRRREAATA
ncbi:MAG: oligosaccharide flippase family protein [Actinobacteria bacterium]|nr:oligosaccharide flippase family protein [Actinomycetota bacterium]